MSCKITGEIMSVIKSYDADKSSVCSKHPCKAKVKIIEVGDCGSSIAVPLNAGDIVELQFAYSLDNTSTVFPEMKAHYPGLKKGDMFSAFSEQRLKIGSGGGFVVYAYKKIKTKYPRHKFQPPVNHSIHKP